MAALAVARVGAMAVTVPVRGQAAVAGAKMEEVRPVGGIGVASLVALVVVALAAAMSAVPAALVLGVVAAGTAAAVVLTADGTRSSAGL